jgi:hypothetical protein
MPVLIFTNHPPFIESYSLDIKMSSTAVSVCGKGWDIASACIPNLNGACYMTLRRFWIHRARMRQTKPSYHGLEGVGASRRQRLHPKLEWSCHLTPRRFWIHRARMRQTENRVIMASKGWEHLDAGACIPNSNGLVRRPRDDFGSIG